ncbi:16S rRNA (guanine(966)-N(2))-methyltransferase RsmD [Diaphorobacter sp. HDW4B]|uniref:16S rRNA (guanine(966)-N(2))-methyltransferase RsmD n=1 Tax=Diaphorobacter sp. HDW4B TaxID=2714925 RepID=UPI00140D055C|nr:16S rRNA (guanine(966)-N(2))-methyltransferase RsmD [Diaphorobacter sp. HDW4B]QIL71735.1 16S rRNA (guanine(966)-N(2))-methyltransferase RsmD [Diaphorobacter sp. HDW4B]
MLSEAAKKKAAAASKPAAPARGAGEVRIVGGQWKRTRLPVADRPGLRPTPDRVRETLFNWLGQDLTGWQCLDVFAGTGALGFEAASRGATQVLMNEADMGLVTQLKSIAAKLKAENVRVLRGDGVAAIKQCAAGSMHLLLLDPPFDSALFKPALEAAAKAVAADGYIYLEAPREWSEEELALLGLGRYRHLKAGAVHAHLLRRAG